MENAAWASISCSRGRNSAEQGRKFRSHCQRRYANLGLSLGMDGNGAELSLPKTIYVGMKKFYFYFYFLIFDDDAGVWQLVE